MEHITDNFPDISFIEDATIEEVLQQMINDYQSEYERITGRKVSLAQADPDRLKMYACAVQIYQGMQYADFAGKMSFLKYARGDYLDELAALKGLSRLQATAATTVLEFRIESAIESAVSIPAGCKVTNGHDVFFATDKYAEIRPGQTSVTVPATCTEEGLSGNDFEAGELKTIVNTLPYIVTVINTVKTSGGSDREDDDSLKDRIYNMPNSYSVAGPSGAYRYHVMLVDPTIVDVEVRSNAPGEVDIYFITDGGNIPDSSVMQKVSDYLNDKKIRPLTDRVRVIAPQTRTYNVELTYYIPSSSSSAVASIQADVNTAVQIYNGWQTSKLGRDINPSRLIQQIMAAGAKRVDVASPSFAVLDGTTIAKTGTVKITYGGVEDD